MKRKTLTFYGCKFPNIFVVRKHFAHIFLQYYLAILIPLTVLTLPYFCACPKPELDFQYHMLWSFLCSMI